MHAERLIHKLVGFNERQRRAIERVRARVWWFYKARKAYCRDPTPRRKAALDKRFERLFSTRTGFATLDRLLERLRANRARNRNESGLAGGKSRTVWPTVRLRSLGVLFFWDCQNHSSQLSLFKKSWWAQ